MQRGDGGVWREPGKGLESYKMSAKYCFVLNGQAALLSLSSFLGSSDSLTQPATASLKCAAASTP